MSTVLFFLGALLTGGAFYDFLRTTISLRGLGPVSSAVTSLLWRGFRRFAPWAERRLGTSIRGLIGPTILTAIAASWIILHLAGYTLMYWSAPSLEHADTGASAVFIDTVAFAGSALSTLGASTVTPTNGWWDALSMIAAVNGMIVLTLSVSYILSILQTTSAARTFAARYHARIDHADSAADPDVPGEMAELGAGLCRLAVDLRTSPLAGVFVPSDPRLSLPAAVTGLAGLLDPDPRPRRDTAELREGLRLLGELGPGDPTDVPGAARAWAQKHTLPNRTT